MAIESRTLSGKNPKLRINLTEMFGQRVPDSQVFREGVGQAVIDAISVQAKSGRDRNGKKFSGRASKYSKAYADSLAFKAAGKSRGNVNMTLTGDMLGFMDVVDQGRDYIVIGFADRDDQQKAHGHILGSNPGPKVKRDFFGLPPKTYESLTENFSLPPEEPPAAEVSALGTLLTLRQIFGEG